ncbi:hypothetical protein Bca52824_048467 [Brassica carinata]|uniref:Uncharacterized protein n=1 Tax=Brassica carinata TaxID=52824 RepID=A0A8X7RGK6_BRACI|nr:hypothetical protein Bca52824_048467 [Brassica carinata]
MVLICILLPTVRLLHDLIELGELDNAREEEMGELIALDMRVTALEEKMEALDILLASLEAYVEEVGDDSPEDVKEREKKGKGVKRSHWMTT